MGNRQMIDPTDYRVKHTIVGLILGTLRNSCFCDRSRIRCSRCYLLDSVEETLPVFYFEAKSIYDRVMEATGEYD
jgi:hexokinase